MVIMEHVFKVALRSNSKEKKSKIPNRIRKVPDYEQLRFANEDINKLSRYIKVQRLKLYASCSLHDFEQFKYILNEKMKFNDLILDIKATIPLEQFQITTLTPNKEQIEYLFANIVDAIYKATGLSFVIYKSRNIRDYRVFSKLYKCKQERGRLNREICPDGNENFIENNAQINSDNNGTKGILNSNNKKRFDCNSKMLLSIHKNYGFLQIILQHKIQHEPLISNKNFEELLDRLMNGDYTTIDVDNHINNYNYYNSNNNVDNLTTYNDTF
ncbi:hypothetical protein TPHA_0G02110 [Tetrapisispora phaffii CBS 4417]|uniref:Uncharacterized protein n=1 Tax=Tetrapisispora phaffii (strain ATCC 24235 / CBS 4417 / NBRC 1672 / NRRL Y-8282 / UCD 70-5) TaxID=1071381 RepID=G8BVW9_TETPH|nr:hypothetical protein TPHA_0G02110 [Tetrapisispora phaffii CBS 4417]CCE64047.1 hypothetical protein TPHA_0G02110 [Tetrapisispora phaffii CBS 4417]